MILNRKEDTSILVHRILCNKISARHEISKDVLIYPTFKVSTVQFLQL